MEPIKPSLPVGAPSQPMAATVSYPTVACQQDRPTIVSSFGGDRNELTQTSASLSSRPTSTSAQTNSALTNGSEAIKLPKPSDDVYEIKRMEFLGKNVPILLQSKNGPCPLLAIANQMLLSNRLSLPDSMQELTLEQLIHMVAEKLLDLNPIDESSLDSGNKHKALDDAIETLPTLAKGLDVNVKFSDVDQFEFDRNIAVFDMVGVALYHGWVIDELDEAFHTMRNLTYNALVERMVIFDLKFGHDDVAVAAAFDNPELQRIAVEGDVAQRFLASHASQLTYTGLTRLHEKVKERELCAIFRNNHFATMFKLDGQLYLLCTDSGFKHRTAVAWERLTDIDGDTQLCSPSFGDPNAYLSAEDAYAEVSADAVLAQQMQLEEDARSGNNRPISTAGTGGNAVRQPPSSKPGAMTARSPAMDVNLAWRLKVEEDELARKAKEREVKQETKEVQPSGPMLWDGKRVKSKPKPAPVPGPAPALPIPSAPTSSMPITSSAGAMSADEALAWRLMQEDAELAMHNAEYSATRQPPQSPAVWGGQSQSQPKTTTTKAKSSSSNCVVC